MIQQMEERLLNQMDIIRVISETHPLRKIAPGQYLGICPFHTEGERRTFEVSHEAQKFSCSICHCEGNLIDFAMKLTNMARNTVIDHLAKKANLALDPESQEYKLREEMYRANLLAANFFHEQLLKDPVNKKGETPLGYITGRGLTMETINTFRIGYAPEGWSTLLEYMRKQGFSDEFLERCGLVSSKDMKTYRRYWDKFRDRVIFPIQDEQGRYIGFGGRSMNKEMEPKYLNSPETPVFKKGQVLYNIHRALPSMQSEGCSVIMEGYMDVVTAYQNGIQNVVACCGTALSLDQVRLTQRFAPEIVTIFDGDSAGQKASERSKETIADTSLIHKIAVIPDDLDPDEHIKAYGVESLRDILKHAEVAEPKGALVFL